LEYPGLEGSAGAEREERRESSGKGEIEREIQ